jgi:hypothetical protein
MDKLIKQLQIDYPTLQFESGSMFCWSPKQQSVVFKSTSGSDIVAVWSLLHEVGHALLDHHDYASDFELLKLEVEAWTKAEELAHIYKYAIDADHIQDCLDTYRDWLYQRSTCPTCTNTSLQSDAKTYTCFNCGTTWHVSGSRMCRPYRRKQKAASI